MAQKIKRKKYFVLFGFQIRYILYILLFLYAGAAIAGYTVYYTTWVTLGEKLANVYPRGRLIYIFQSANMELLIRLLLITPLFILIGTLLSHRIAGPIYRIGKYVDQLMNGDYSHMLTLRKKDELKIIATKLSELSTKLCEDKNTRLLTVESVLGTLKKNNVDARVLQEVETKLKGMNQSA
ncbi:MAG TPA: hypothetical protein PKY78_08480 [Candidatus Omnitrophota bacterium]|nr:hypothetical protein [Candidatus Omnitrophota bacterium]